MGINYVKKVCFLFCPRNQTIIVFKNFLLQIKFCRENISYAAMCNSAGQNFGMFLGYVMLIILVSESFWNKWWRTLPRHEGLITLQGKSGIYCLIKTNE